MARGYGLVVVRANGAGGGVDVVDGEAATTADELHAEVYPR